MSRNKERMLLDRYLRWSRDIREARRDTLNLPHLDHSYLRGRRDEARDQALHLRVERLDLVAEEGPESAQCTEWSPSTYYLEGRKDEADQIKWLERNEELECDTDSPPPSGALRAALKTFRVVHELLGDLADRTEQLEERLEMEQMTRERDDLACHYDEQA